MIGYIISGMCVMGSAYLAYSNIPAWPWFLMAGIFMFMTSAGSEMKIRGS